jgi:cold shock protein
VPDDYRDGEIGIQITTSELEGLEVVSNPYTRRYMSCAAQPYLRRNRDVFSGTELDIPTLGSELPKETRMSSGTIKRLVRDRGFGFIRDDGGQEWFFHRSAVQGSFDQLNEGQRVSFDEEPSAKGPRAGNVRSEG